MGLFAPGRQGAPSPGQILGSSIDVAAGRRVGALASFHLEPGEGPYFLSVQETTALRSSNNNDVSEAQGVLHLTLGTGGGSFRIEIDIKLGMTFPLNGTNFTAEIENQGSVDAKYNLGIMKGSPGAAVFTRTFNFNRVAAGVGPSSGPTVGESTPIDIAPYANRVSLNIPASAFAPGRMLGLINRAAVVIAQWELTNPTVGASALQDIPAQAVRAVITQPVLGAIPQGVLIWHLAL